MTAEIISLQRPLLVQYRNLLRAVQREDHEDVGLITERIVDEVIEYMANMDSLPQVAIMVGKCAAIMTTKTERFRLLMGVAMKAAQESLKDAFDIEFKKALMISFQEWTENKSYAYLIPGILSYAWQHEVSVFGRPNDKLYLDSDDMIIYAAMHDELSEDSSLLRYWKTINGFNLEKPIYNATPLMIAARTGSIKSMTYLMKDVKVDIHYRNPDGDDAFSIAICNHNVSLKALNLLAIYGIDVHHVDAEGKNAYFHVASYPVPRTDVMRWLDNHKLDMTWQDKLKRTPLMNALMMNNHDVSKYIIENHWHDINAQDNFGMTGLMLYIKNFGNDVEFIRYLIEKGADPDIKNLYGRTIIDLASAYRMKSQERLVKFLITYQEEGVLDAIAHKLDDERTNVIQLFAKK